MGVNHKAVLDFYIFMLMEFFQLHTIKQGFIHAICNPASECCCILVFFYFPYCYWINCTWERSIYSSC